VIVLTGDLHHQRLGTGNQAHCPISEIQAAGRYLALLEGAGVKTTFFVSGRAFDEEWEDLRPIARHPLVEIGGHGYDCFEPAWVHRACLKLLGSYAGSPGMIRRDVRRTRRAIERRTGRRIRLWRNHMYMHGPYTKAALAAEGIELVSDGVRRGARGPRRTRAGIFSFPLNVMPDHEHLLHAERTPEHVAWFVRRHGWSDDFGSASYPIEEWVDRVLAQLEENEARGVISHMIVHPITMYVADGFAGFERLLAYLATRETRHLGEVLDAARDARARAGGCEEVRS